MTDNVERIRTMLSFDDKDDFYFLQVLKRRKDNPGMEKDMIIIDNFFFDSIEDYDKKVPHIIHLCDSENARAYIRVNRRNYKKLGPHLLKRVVDVVFTENCRSLRSAFVSVAEEYHSDPDKKWIVDADDDKNLKQDVLLEKLIELQKESRRTPMTEIVPTKNGYHVITRPFNLQLFRFTYPSVDVHKDNPTILYCP